MPDTNFDAALAAFLAHCNGLQVDYAKDLTAQGGNPTLPRDTITADSGGVKYIRIVRNNYGDPKARSAYCFVDATTGDVLKAASFKTPAKGVRGSIFTPAQYGVTRYGAVYNR